MPFPRPRLRFRRHEKELRRRQAEIERRIEHLQDVVDDAPRQLHGEINKRQAELRLRAVVVRGQPALPQTLWDKRHPESHDEHAIQRPLRMVRLARRRSEQLIFLLLLCLVTGAALLLWRLLPILQSP